MPIDTQLVNDEQLDAGHLFLQARAKRRSSRASISSLTSAAAVVKLADLMDASEHDVLAYMAFPRQHRTKLHSTNPIERLNKEVKRRADVVGIFPNEASIMRLIGAVLFEQNDEWQTSSRYMMVEAFAQIDREEIDPILSITTKAA